MVIENAKYLNSLSMNDDGSVKKEVTDISCTMNGVINVSVPIDPDNADYVEIMRQVDAGTLTIEDAD
tara:strand:- start:13 stop:213 length:201 start_codon:yes stop_codon:yes gene_type:complete